MTASDWGTIANLATALGTLILAVATFSAVRSSNTMARVAQRQLLIGLRPVLITSRRDDATLKVNFGDSKWVKIPGGGAVGEVGPGDGVVYLAVSMRNAGNGIAVLHGWRFYPGWVREPGHAPQEWSCCTATTRAVSGPLRVSPPCCRPRARTVTPIRAGKRRGLRR